LFREVFESAIDVAKAYLPDSWGSSLLRRQLLKEGKLDQVRLMDAAKLKAVISKYGSIIFTDSQVGMITEHWKQFPENDPDIVLVQCFRDRLDEDEEWIRNWPNR
jgi:hypothetical protein